jgi:ATP-binding cassette subfamily B (MDR/TAP) protein 1
MWDLIDESVGAVPPNCGCSYKAGTFSVESVCFTGGKTILVFFSILVGGFGLGTAGPGATEMGTARIAAAKMLETINRKPLVDINQPGKKLTGKVAGELVLDNVMFEYKKKGTGGAAAGEDVQPVFGGVNLKIPAGKTVALVGESGCGKSTIAKLVQRFYDPSGGSILLDGTDLKKLDLKDLRSNIGVVSQEPLLFNTSVLENIRNGKPGASDAECIEAAKKANAHEFIDNFPDKYHTGVGPKGSKLSGGQKQVRARARGSDPEAASQRERASSERLLTLPAFFRTQRVAIARAILRNPAVLILDEATSALDNQYVRARQRRAQERLAQAKRARKS